MKISQLIEQLEQLKEIYNADLEVMILDGFNGGGCLRDINIGPTTRTIKDSMSEESADCEGRSGEKVIALGYGCY